MKNGVGGVLTGVRPAGLVGRDEGAEPPLLEGLLKRLELQVQRLSGASARIDAGLNRLGCDMMPPHAMTSVDPAPQNAVEQLALAVSHAEAIADTLSMHADRLDRTI